MSDSYRLEPGAIRRSFTRAAESYDASAALQSEVRERMLARLQIIRSKPEVILDLGAGTGHASRALKKRFPRAVVVALDFTLAMLRQSRRQQRVFRRFGRVCADALRLPVRNQSVDWCVSNLMLPWCDPMEPVFEEVGRVLKPGGLFSFTSFGPDTLRELRTAWAAVDSGPHVHRFVDMHDVGDALVRTGLSEPVLDTERIVLTYRDLPQMVGELKATGATTVTRGRSRGLTGRRSLQALTAAYESLRIDSRLPLTFEIVYGQAWRSHLPTKRERDPETRIGIEKIGGRRNTSIR